MFGAGAALREGADRLVEPLTVSYFSLTSWLALVPGLYQCLIYLLVVVALGRLVRSRKRSRSLAYRRGPAPR